MAVVVMPRVSVPVRVYTPPPAARVSAPASRPAVVQEAPHTNVTPVIVTSAILTGAALHSSNARATENETPITETKTEVPEVSVSEPLINDNSDTTTLIFCLGLIFVFGAGTRIIQKIPNRKKRRLYDALLMLFVFAVAAAYIYLK